MAARQARIEDAEAVCEVLRRWPLGASLPPGTLLVLDLALDLTR